MGAVGSYTRFIPNSADNDEFNENLRRAHDGLEPVRPRSTPEQIKQDYEEALAADETRINNFQMSDEFVLLHPEFLDHKKNGEIFNATLNVMFGANRAYTIEQFEQVYQVCLANRSLELDQTEIVKQQQRAADAQRKALTKKRQERERSRNLSEVELETISLEELRAITERELGAEMQAAGERGGNGW